VAAYDLRVLNEAARDLEQLDKSVGRRVAKRLRWLSENLDNITPEALTGSLAGLYKFRIGDYRVFYEVLRDERIIVVHLIGHRRDIYKRK